MNRIFHGKNGFSSVPFWLPFSRGVQSRSFLSRNRLLFGKTHYETLGVSKSATAEEIKAAYKKLAMEYHPDRNKSPGAEDKFKSVAEAYTVLSNERSKREYDLGMGSYGRQPFPGGYPQQQGYPGARPMSPQEAEALFREIFGAGFGPSAFSRPGFSGQSSQPGLHNMFGGNPFHSPFGPGPRNMGGFGGGSEQMRSARIVIDRDGSISREEVIKDQSGNTYVRRSSVSGPSKERASSSAGPEWQQARAQRRQGPAGVWGGDDWPGNNQQQQRQEQSHHQQQQETQNPFEAFREQFFQSSQSGPFRGGNPTSPFWNIARHRYSGWGTVLLICLIFSVIVSFIASIFIFHPLVAAACLFLLWARFRRRYF